MLPLRSAFAASRSFFSSEFMSGMGFVAFSAPEGYLGISKGGLRRQVFWLTPSSTGTEKYSTPVSLTIASPPETPGRYIKVGSTIPFSPMLAFMSFSAKLYY